MQLPTPLTALRILQLLLTILVLGLEAYVASWYNSSPFLIACPASVAFLIFVSVWTGLVVLPYVCFAPRYVSTYITHPLTQR
jgi:hypothetical protein